MKEQGLLEGKKILITGGTGSFGTAMVDILVNRYNPKRIIIYSRDELKQFQFAKKYQTMGDGQVRLLIGDVRDKDRLYRAMKDVDYVFHAAALKQVPSCEYNPDEAVKTNIDGALNVIDCAIRNEVYRVVMLSTDKAVNPINLYGATKLVSEKLFIHGNTLTQQRATKFSVVRYGNVLGSRGSVIETFEEQKKEHGKLFLTDPSMTRFWWTIEQACNFVLFALANMHGGEIFVPEIEASTMGELAIAYGGDIPVEVIGRRPGEKMHESLISQDEVSRTNNEGWCYLIVPEGFLNYKYDSMHRVSKDFSFTSNTQLMENSISTLRKMIME